MAEGAINLIVSKEAQAQVDKLMSQLDAIESKIVTISNTGLGKKAGWVDVTSQEKLAKALKTNTELSAQLAKEQGNVLKLNKQLNNTINGEVSAYDLLQKSQRENLAAYNSLITKKATMGKLNAQEELDLKQIELQLKKNQKTYSAVAAGQNKLGISSKRTGVAFDSLGFSVAQLTRESPAFLNSVQTGFMALSNNIPIFVDEVNRLILTNKELKASGQETKSVLGSVGKAFFSMQSLISLVILAITILGPKLFKMGQEWWDTSRGIDSAKVALDDMNNVLTESYAEAGRGIAKMSIFQKSLTDLSKTEKERMEVVAQARKEYGDDIKHLTDMELLTNGLTDAEKDLKKAIMERALASAAAKKIEENMAKILELEAKRPELIENTANAQKSLNEAANDDTVRSANNMGMLATSTAASAGAVNGWTDKLIKNSQELNSLYKSNQMLLDKTIVTLDKADKKASKKGEKPFYLEDVDPDTINGLKILIGYNNQLIGFGKDRATVQKLQEENELYQKQIDYLMGIGAAYKSNADKIAETVSVSMDEYDRAVERLGDLKGDLAFSGIDLAQGLVDGIFGARIEAIDLEMEKLQERYDLQRELIDSEIEDEETKKQRKKELDKEEQLRLKELEKKKRAEEKKAFLISQAIAIGEIILSTSMGVAEASAMGPATFGASLSWIPFIIGIGAAQIATVLAQSIPAFKDGHLEGTYSGTALINDGGSMEVLERKDGSLELSSRRNKLVHMNKGDLVHKDLESFIGTIPQQALLQQGMISPVQMSSIMVSDKGAFDEAFKNAMLETISKGLNGTRIVNDNKAVGDAVREALSDINYTKNFL